MVHIQRVEGDEIEEYTCMMPRYYAVPLILMNKRLAFLEASCRPDGTPLLPPTDDGGVKQSDTREYAYLWRVRTRFLQAVFDMNHERRLDEHWRYHGIHGFVYRLYRRYGHDLFQRHVYWRDEIKAGRVPYATPDIADMGMYLPIYLFSPLFSSFITPPFPPFPFHASLARGESLHRLFILPMRSQ